MAMCALRKFFPTSFHLRGNKLVVGDLMASIIAGGNLLGLGGTNVNSSYKMHPSFEKHVLIGVARGDYERNVAVQECFCCSWSIFRREHLFQIGMEFVFRSLTL